MGLDMYLHASRYVSGWEHSSPESKAQFDAIVKAAGMEGVPSSDSPSLTVQATVAYWRKANQIHAWFVNNVQDDKDDCGTYYVGREQLQELRDTCMRVLEATHLEDGPVCVGNVLEDGVWSRMEEPGKVILDPAVAEEHLPSQAGFFFGSTDYDQFYVRDLLDTVEQIDRALALDDAYDFEYHSSW